MKVSEAFWDEAQNLEHIEVLSKPEAIEFDSEGNF
jgi:hypothetical protein